MPALSLDKGLILAKIALQNTVDHTIVCIFSSDNGRFKQEQNALCSVPVGIILSSDLMNEVMTEHHLAKDAFAPWGLGSRFGDHLIDCMYEF